MKNAITRYTIFRRLVYGAFLPGLLWLAPLVARAEEEGIVRYGVTQLALQDNVLSDEGEARFWTTLRLDPDVFPNDKPYIAQQVTPMFNSRIDVYNKPGDLTSPAVSRHAHADAGRLTFPDGQEVLVAIFMDYISDDPDDLLQATGATQSQAQQAIRDVAREVAEQYYPY